MYNLSNSNSLVNFLLEAKDEEDSPDSVSTSEDSEQSDENNDINSEKTSDSETSDVEADTDTDTPTETDGEGTEDDSSNGGSSDSTDNKELDNSTTEPPYEEDSKNNETKLLLYTSLKELRNSFKSILAILDLILTNTIHNSNVLTIKNVRQKVLSNITLLDELLGDVNITKNRSAKDLESIYNVYLADYKAIDILLKTLDKSIKNTSR